MFIAVYRLLARILLPPGFRGEWGSPMNEEARLQWLEGRAEGRWFETARRILTDLVGTAGREWRGVVVARRPIQLGGGGGMGTDLKVAWRGIVRSPGYSAAVVATLGLGIGAVALVFSLVDAFLLRTLPYPEPDRLVSLWSETNWSREMVARARTDLSGLESASGYGAAILVLEEGGEPVELFVGQASAGHLEHLGARPVLGRLLGTDDEAPGAEPVTVLSHDVWMDRFGGDPSVVGRTIALGGMGVPRRTVVGVLPPGFSSLLGEVEAWVPVTFDPAAGDYSDSYFMSGLGRLADPEGVGALRAEIEAWARTMASEGSGGLSAREVEQASVRTLRDEVGRDRRSPLFLALGAALLVLLVACANVANLVVARTTGRQSELSVRAALGSGRTRAARGVLFEVVLLGFAGGALGVAGAIGVAWAVGVRFPGLIPASGLAPSPRVLAFALGVTLVSALLAGVLPALRAAGRDPAGALSGGRGSSGDRGLLRLQGALAATQLGMALVGVAAAGLLGRSLMALGEVDPGFDPEGLVSFRITAPPTAYADDAEILGFHLDVRDALLRVPGVVSAGSVSRLPMGRGQSRITVFPEGFEVPDSGELPEVTHRLVTNGYLETLGARLIEGTLPEADEDRAEGPLRGVVNRAAAERYWPGESAVGRRFLGPGGVVWMEIVGVVEDVRELGVTSPREPPAAYIPLRDWPWRTAYAVVRTRSAADLDALKAAVWSVSPGVPVGDIRPLSALVAETVRPTRLLALLALGVGGVTLLLGGVGVYGVAAYATGRRRREHGIRAALGADRSSLLRGELRRAGRLVFWGTILGLSGAWAVGRALDSVLFGVRAADPWVLSGAAAVLIAAGFAAAWIPARRAAGADPASALRSD